MVSCACHRRKLARFCQACVVAGVLACGIGSEAAAFGLPKSFAVSRGTAGHVASGSPQLAFDHANAALQHRPPTCAAVSLWAGTLMCVIFLHGQRVHRNHPSSRGIRIVRNATEEEELAQAQKEVEAAKAQLEAAKAKLAAAGPGDAAPAPAPASPDALLEEAKRAAEASKLKLEAEKLRSEAETLERARAVERRNERAQRILAYNEGEILSLEDLRARLKQEEGVDLTELQMEQLAAVCGRPLDGKKYFGLQELVSDSFSNKLGEFAAQERAAQQQAQEKARQEAAARAASQAQQQASNSQAQAADPVYAGEVNDNRDTGTRILGALAYILPLADGFQMLIPLLQAFPALGIALLPISLTSAILYSIPFGSLILLVAFIFLAQKSDVPRLLRFNLEQAVLLDIALTLPNLVTALLLATGGIGAVPAISVVSFLILLGASIYAAAVTLGGDYPDGIPVISNTTKNVIDRGTFFDDQR